MEEGATRAEDLRFAIASDIHVIFRPREMGCDRTAVSPPEDRHEAFLAAAEEWGAEVLIDLGDLHPRTFDEGPEKRILESWRAWEGDKIAVLGNHDDDIVDREEYMEKMGMPSEYYSTMVEGWTFIVLYSGDPPSPLGTEGGRHDEKQLEWLRDEIREAPDRCVILVHDGINIGTETTAPAKTKRIIDEANEEAGYRKVVAYFCGHAHRSLASESDGVHYVMINSTTYRWDGHPVYYRDPPPFATGVFYADGGLRLDGAGVADNWAANDCEELDESAVPDDDLTYQVSVNDEREIL